MGYWSCSDFLDPINAANAKCGGKKFVKVHENSRRGNIVDVNLGGLLFAMGTRHEYQLTRDMLPIIWEQAKSYDFTMEELVKLLAFAKQFTDDEPEIFETAYQIAVEKAKTGNLSIADMTGYSFASPLLRNFWVFACGGAVNGTLSLEKGEFVVVQKYWGNSREFRTSEVLATETISFRQDATVEAKKLLRVAKENSTPEEEPLLHYLLRKE